MKFEDFVSRFEFKRPNKDGFMCVCPAHEDSKHGPSLSISRANDGGVLIKCFAGCTAVQICQSLNLTLKDLFAKESPVKFTPPPIREKSRNPDTTEVKPVIEAIYSYRDVDGRELYQAIRLRPKSFRQRHQTESGWVWNMDNVIRVLYRMPEISKSQIVWIVEGEKDADNLSSIGIPATCNVGGAGKWLDSYTESLSGKDIVICGDNDKPGESHVAMVFESIAGKAKTVRTVKLPGMIKDVSDYMATFKDRQEAIVALQELASCAFPHIKGHSMPVYSIGELESDYRRFVRSMGKNALSLGKWLPTLGNNLRFLVPGELVFIIGDTGIGKTGILQQIAKSALPLPTLMFELELPKEMMFERFAAMTTRMTCQEVERAYQNADDSISEQLDFRLSGLCICPVSRITVAQMEEIIMRAELKMGERPKVVLIDYIQLIQAQGPNRREKVSDIAEQLKVMAKATRTIVIVASQISRPKDVDKKWEPSLHSAKESGSIEASCGLLISAWRDFDDLNALNIRVLKSTKGGTGTFVKCNFDGSRMIITERPTFSDSDINQPHNS